MKALVWNGKLDVRVENVPDPKILNDRDAIIRITSSAICGSDLHLYDNVIPTMRPGDILGHEFMGEVVEVGSGVGSKLRIGDRVAVPFAIACGGCYFCEHNLWSLCDNSNPNAWMVEQLYGFGGAALFGYSHLYGGFAGGQAEYVRVPFADVGPLVIPEGIEDEKVLFLTDILPTAYMAAENGNFQPGDVVAVWGCGPVGLLSIMCAFVLGAERVIAIDSVDYRLEVARQQGAETLNFTQTDTIEALKELTAGRGPDVCIDAVGLEAHGITVDALMDRAKYLLRLTTDHAHALRQAIQACRKGGTVSVPGVYGGFIDKFPFGAAFAKGLQLRTGQTHVHAYMRPLLERIQRGEIDPTFIITHRLSLDMAPTGYEIFKNNRENVVKVVLKP